MKWYIGSLMRLCSLVSSSGMLRNRATAGSHEGDVLVADAGVSVSVFWGEMSGWGYLSGCEGVFIAGEGEG